MDRTIHQEVLRKTDVNHLLKTFTNVQIALVFKVDTRYVNKIANIQKLIPDSFIDIEEEMNLGRKGEWMESQNRVIIKSINNK